MYGKACGKALRYDPLVSKESVRRWRLGVRQVQSEVKYRSSEDVVFKKFARSDTNGES